MPPRRARAKAAPAEEAKEAIVPASPVPAARPPPSVVSLSPSKSDPCAICLEELTAPGAPPTASLDRCPHRFHSACISDWAQVTNLCPLCKTRFKSITEIPSADGPTPVRAGLRQRKKVMRVATRNQVVEFTDSSEEESEEEAPAVRSAAAMRAMRSRRRQEQKEDPAAEEAQSNEEEEEEDAPPPRRARGGRPAAAARAPARSRRSATEEDKEEEQQQTTSSDDDNDYVSTQRLQHFNSKPMKFGLNEVFFLLISCRSY
jgi:hypothetical protein